MGDEEGKMLIFETPITQLHKKDGNPCDDDHHNANTISSTSSSSIGSSSSLSSSLDASTEDDASSSNGSLYNLSDLMSQLPIKRGLSKYYQGKSQSFACISRVKSVEDLVKKETPCKNRRKKLLGSCKSFQGLDSYKSFTHPKPIISKKTTNRTHFRRNLLPVQENVVQVTIIDRP